MRRILCVLGSVLAAGCLDNAGPEDHAAQQIRVVSAPAGERFPTDTLAEAVVVQVTDERGNPSPGRPVAWSASHGGELIGATGVTDQNGEARATWVLGAAPGTQTATASVPSTDLSVSSSVETAGWRVASVAASRGTGGCAIDLTGDTHCWLATAPTPVRIETPVRFRALAMGQRHACGLGDDDRVYCWGSNDLGQLGDGTTTDRTVPTAVSLPAGGFKSVVAGNAATCAVALTNEAWCWGENDQGALGRGFASASEATPAPVIGGASWRSISTSGWATCGVDLDRQVLCWGEGDSDGPPVLTPQAVEGFEADTVALSDWAKCALASTALYCWGSETGIAVPTAMNATMISISAGYKPIFGLGTDGLGYYWGGVPNSSYGWGDPPIAIEGGMRFRMVGGNDHTPLAIELETSSLYQWSEYQFDSVRRPLGPQPIRPPD